MKTNTKNGSALNELFVDELKDILDAEKQLVKALPKIRRRVQRDLRRKGMPREKVLAAVVKLLDRTHLRVGNAEYVKANGSFGLSTLLDRHVTFTGTKLRLRFRGKSGVRQDQTQDEQKRQNSLQQDHGVLACLAGMPDSIMEAPSGPDRTRCSTLSRRRMIRR